MVLAVQDDLKDPNFSATRIQRYLNYGQQAIFNTHMFKFCQSQPTARTLAAGSYTFDNPDDLQTTLGGWLVDDTNSNRTLKLDKHSYVPSEQFFDLYPDPSRNSADMPFQWTEYGNTIYFDRPLDAACTLLQRYYRMPAIMKTDSAEPEVPEAFRELIEMYAEYRSEKYRGNHDVAATYLQDFEDGLENMVMRYGQPTMVEATTMRSARVRVE